jgi:prevent-host-death family protein
VGKRKPVTKTIPAATARTQFGQLLELSQRKGIRFVVSKNGEPAVVIIPIADYLERTGGTPETLAKVQAAAKRRRLDLLKLRDVNREVAAVRRRQRSKPRRP